MEELTLSAACFFIDPFTMILVLRISSNILERNGDTEEEDGMGRSPGMV